MQGLTWITAHRDAAVDCRGTIGVRTAAVAVSKANRQPSVMTTRYLWPRSRRRLPIAVSYCVVQRLPLMAVVVGQQIAVGQRRWQWGRPQQLRWPTSARLE